MKYFVLILDYGHMWEIPTILTDDAGWMSWENGIFSMEDERKKINDPKLLNCVYQMNFKLSPGQKVFNLSEFYRSSR